MQMAFSYCVVSSVKCSQLFTIDNEVNKIITSNETMGNQFNPFVLRIPRLSDLLEEAFILYIN